MVNAALALFMLLFATIGSLGILSNISANKQLELVDRVAVKQSDYAQAGNRNLLNATIVSINYYENHLQSGDASGAGAALLTRMDNYIARAEDFLGQFRKMPAFADDEGRQLAGRFDDRYAALLDELKRMRAALHAGNASEFKGLEVKVVTEHLPGMAVAMRQLADYMNALTARQMDEHRATVESYASVALLLAIISALSLYFLRSGLFRLVVQPLGEAVEHLERLARADLAEPIAVTLHNEVGHLQAAMKRMQDSLAEIVTTVRDSSESILVGTRQIAAGNEDLSSRTEQQASSLEETASSMEELTATVKQNAENARQASALANDASHTADHGREVVAKVVETMREISDSSQRIGNIIGVIDSIAFQTNILALNASVEAARAGDQGRGFAVVASEVRALASRSAEAAHEIKLLIEESAHRVEGGAHLVEEAGTTMLNVVQAAHRVSDIIDEISAASQEQSQGLGQVNTAVTQLDDVTQQNASLVQQAAAASSSLAEQAQRMERAVAVFHLRDEQQRQQARMQQERGPAPDGTGAARCAAPPPRPSAAAMRQADEAEWSEF